MGRRNDLPRQRRCGNPSGVTVTDGLAESETVAGLENVETLAEKDLIDLHSARRRRIEDRCEGRYQLAGRHGDVSLRRQHSLKPVVRDAIADQCLSRIEAHA